MNSHNKDKISQITTNLRILKGILMNSQMYHQIRIKLAKLMKYVQICNTIEKPMG